MNTGNEKDQRSPPEDAFYQAEYDEDTIDYDLDSDKLLEEDYFELESGDNTAKMAEPPNDAEYEPESDEEWYDDDEPEDEEYIDSWPLSLIAVGIVALLLLAAGGYGVLQQRTAMQEEIRQLRATLATTTSNTELSASRQAQRRLVSHNEELSSQLELLKSENQKLKAEPSSAVKQPIKPKSVPTQTLTAPAKGGWFVNFGSYSQRPMADHWASKLNVEKGRVVVLPGNKSGTQYFRVRVIDLPNQEIAGKIARQLEKTYKLPRLWVGEQ